MKVAERDTIHFSDVKIMLLGSGQTEYLQLRKKVRDELKSENGFNNVMIMEETATEDKDITLDDKLRRIITEINPDLYIAIFSKGPGMDGVAFELGWLCCRYSSGVDKKIRILSDKAFDWDNITSYIPSLFVRIQFDIFDESRNHRRASTLINRAVRETFGRELPD
jgi:hypothetical protein